MNFLFRLLRSHGSAPVARERLQILLAHERLEHKESDLLSKLREEILVVIAKHISLDRDKVQVKVDRGGTVSMLEIDIELPHDSGPLLAAAG